MDVDNYGNAGAIAEAIFVAASNKPDRMVACKQPPTTHD